jgi:hypothetical protein
MELVANESSVEISRKKIAFLRNEGRLIHHFP